MNENWSIWLFITAWVVITAWLLVGTIKVLRDYKHSTEELRQAVAEAERLDAIAGELLDEEKQR